jgi:hypothetical protein
VFMLVWSEPYLADLGLRTITLGAAALLLAAAGFSWLNWRCPACKKHLGLGLFPSHCPECRVELSSQ